MLFLVCFVWIVNTSFAWEIRILNSYEIKEEIKKNRIENKLYKKSLKIPKLYKPKL